MIDLSQWQIYVLASLTLVGLFYVLSINKVFIERRHNAKRS